MNIVKSNMIMIGILRIQFQWKRNIAIFIKTDSVIDYIDLYSGSRIGEIDIHMTCFHLGFQSMYNSIFCNQLNAQLGNGIIQNALILCFNRIGELFAVTEFLNLKIILRIFQFLRNGYFFCIAAVNFGLYQLCLLYTSDAADE